MRPLISHIPLTACALATALLVSACGGGDASAPAAVIGSSGFAVDGYISGATVVCDANGNGASDAGEAVALTDSDGFFKFTATCASTLVVTGGKNTDTDLDFVGKLRAPVGSTMVTPLTTLLAEGMTTDQINKALGLPDGVNVTTLDPARKVGGELENANLFRKTLAVQQVLQKTAETLAALVGSTDVAAMYSQAAAAMAIELRKGGSTLISGDKVVLSTVSAVVRAAAERVQAPVNADSLAQVMSDALEVQTNRILAADGALDIKNTTKAVQGSTVIAAFVTANKASLMEAPGPTTAELGRGLIAEISGDSNNENTGCGTTEPTCAPTTSIPADAITVYSEAVSAGNLDAFPNWGQTTQYAEATLAGNKSLKYTNLNYQGIQFDPVNVASKGVVHFDLWTPDMTEVKISIISEGKENAYTQALTKGSWNSVAINLSNYTVPNLSAIFQIKLEAITAGGTLYVDNIYFGGTGSGGGTDTPTTPTSCATDTQQCISFSESKVAALGFEGLVSAAVADDPVVGATNRVLKMVKGPNGGDKKAWAGATVYTMGTVSNDPAVHSVLTIDTVGLNTSKTVTLRSYSSAPVGTKITLKLENGIDPGQNIAAETVTTQQNAWETLTFNFANLTTGVFSSSTIYNTASIFPSFSINGSYEELTSETSFYFDDLKYAIAMSTPVTPTEPTGCGTTEPTCAPTTSIPADAITVYSEAVSAGNLDAFPNWGQTTQYAEATLAGNKSLKYTNLNYQGIQFDPVNVASKGVVHFDLWTPDMTEVKISIISEGKENAYTQALTKGSWNSVAINLSNYTVPNLSAIFQIKLEAITAGGTLYVDNIYFGGTGSGGGTDTPTTGGNLPNGVFAANYSGETIADWKSTAGGEAGFYSGGGENWWSGMASSDATPNFYFGYGMDAAAKPWGLGAYVKAPANGVANVSGYANLKLAVWGNDQLADKNPRPTFTAVLNAPAIGDCTPAIKRDFQVTGTGVQNYVLPLGGFSLQEACGLASVAAVLATGVTQVNVQVLGDNLQYTKPGDGSTLYPNGLNMGPISFN